MYILRAESVLSIDDMSYSNMSMSSCLVALDIWCRWTITHHSAIVSIAPAFH